MYMVKSQKFCCFSTFFPKTFPGKISIAYIRYKNSNSNKIIIIIIIIILIVVVVIITIVIMIMIMIKNSTS